MFWVETPRKPLWQLIDEEEGATTFVLMLTPSRDSVNSPLFLIERANLPKVKVEPTGWPLNLARGGDANNTPLEVGEWRDPDDL